MEGLGFFFWWWFGFFNLFGWFVSLVLFFLLSLPITSFLANLPCAMLAKNIHTMTDHKQEYQTSFVRIEDNVTLHRCSKHVHWIVNAFIKTTRFAKTWLTIQIFILLPFSSMLHARALTKSVIISSDWETAKQCLEDFYCYYFYLFLKCEHRIWNVFFYLNKQSIAYVSYMKILIISSQGRSVYNL